MQSNQSKRQSVYTKSGCRSPNSIQALNFPSASSSPSTIYFSSNFLRSSGRFLTLFFHDRYATLTRAIMTRTMALVVVKKKKLDFFRIRLQKKRKRNGKEKKHRGNNRKNGGVDKLTKRDSWLLFSWILVLHYLDNTRYSKYHPEIKK